MTKLLLWLLEGYKRWLSPMLPVACRYTPTCSDYAAEAIVRHGALGGSLLGLGRLLRCHPLGGRGLDPVPRHFCLGHRHPAEEAEAALWPWPERHIRDREI